MTPECRGCRSGDVQQVETFGFSDIWDAAELHLDIAFTAAIRDRLSPAPETTLYRCYSCGLDSFWPAHAGDGAYYSHLSQSPNYYEGDRWEFGRVADTITVGQSVLDIGCGPGVFLEAAGARGGAIHGVDDNPSVHARLEELGAQVYLSLDEAREGGPFDLVCGFQVVEHVEDVEDFLSAMVGLVADGGRLAISVPNRERVNAGNLEGLDFPPHHMTRWSPETMVELCRRHGLEALQIECEPPHPSLFRQAVGERLARRGVAKAWKISRGLINSHSHQVLTRLGLHRRWGMHGHSVVGLFRGRS